MVQIREACPHFRQFCEHMWRYCLCPENWHVLGVICSTGFLKLCNLQVYHKQDCIKVLKLPASVPN